LLDEATLNHNVGYKGSVVSFLDFNSKEANGAVLVNYDWMKELSLSILPVMWVNITVNYMMARIL
jgi:hypothetical protein